MTESKIKIPIDSKTDEKGSIVGILRRQNNSSSSSKSNSTPKPIILILHGVLAHKDQLYHRKLAEELPCDSFRFDFRHSDQGGESSLPFGKSWHMSNFDQDVLDIHTVILFLRNSFGYKIESIIAHSRGVLNMWQYFWDVEMRKLNAISNQEQNFILDPIPFYVALSGRWNMERMRERFKDSEELKSKGYYTWNVKVAGKKFNVKVTEEMINGFCNFPIAEMTNRFPSQTDVLLIHGTKDLTVPFQDAFAYMDKLQNHMPSTRRIGSTDLHLIEDADHTFKGHFDEVIKVICNYLDERRKIVQEGVPEASPAAISFQKTCSLALNSNSDRDLINSKL